MKIKRFLFKFFPYAFLTLTLLFGNITAYAAEPEQPVDVSIKIHDTANDIDGLTKEVTVCFYDLSLYNENVYLSYHFVDANGNIIQFENQRIPLVVDDSMTAVVTVTPVIPSEITMDNTTLYVQFDLVDQANAYWFSFKPDISFSTDTFEVDSKLDDIGTIPIKLLDPFTNVIIPFYQQPAFLAFMFALACICIVILLVLIVQHIAKRERFSIHELFRSWMRGLPAALAVGCFPAVFLFCNNTADVSLFPSFKALLLSALLAAVWLLFSIFVAGGQFYRGTIVACLGLLLFWNFNMIDTTARKLLPTIYYWHTAIVLLAIYLCSSVIFLCLKERELFNIITTGIAVGFGALMVVNIVPAVPKLLRGGIVTASGSTEYRTVSSVSPTRDYPNIYLFVFDEYSSSEMIEKYYNYDNSAVEVALEEMGFQYSHGSRYGYAGTVYGVQTTMNMEYPTELTVAALENAQKDGKAFQLFRQYGYETTYYSSGLDAVENDFQKMLFQQSALRPLYISSSFDYWYDAYARFFDFALSRDYSYQQGHPQFIYMHFDMPHSPYMFDRNGGRLPNRYALDYFSDYPYLEQYQYANKLMISLAQKVIADDPNAVIMLQSDHSMRWLYTYHDQFYPDYCEILNALYFQGRTPFDNNGLNGGNTMRQVANQVLNTNFPLLENDYDEK